MTKVFNKSIVLSLRSLVHANGIFIVMVCEGKKVLFRNQLKFID